MSGVTDQLIDLSNFIRYNNIEKVTSIIGTLKDRHYNVIMLLTESEALIEKVHQKIDAIFNRILALLSKPYQDDYHSIIVTSGEVLLTTIVSEFLHNEGVCNTLLKADSFMSIKTPSNPDIDAVEKNISVLLGTFPKCNLFITQGFVYQKSNGKIGHLSRGGSDFSAAIIGAAVKAEEVQIWTDVNGVLNNDPRYVDGTYTVLHSNYEEAAELAFFGAKILHPMTTQPLAERKIPILVKNTFNPQSIGTIISEEQQTNGIKGVAAKDNINLIDIELNSQDEPNAYIKLIFDLFNKHQVNIDMSSSSRTSILLAVRDHNYLDLIVEKIGDFCSVKLKRDQTIISVVGNFILSNQTGLKIFQNLNCSDIKMIMYGASKNSISMLVDKTNKVKLLKTLNEKLFGIKEELVSQI